MFNENTLGLLRDAPAQAAVTGSGGQYVPMPSNARVLGGATEKGVFCTVKVAGVAGLPSSGIGAVTVMVTIADPSGSGQLQMRADDADTTTLMMIYNSGVGGNRTRACSRSLMTVVFQRR